MNKKTIILLLILIIFAGTFLRFYKIGDESFWLDESATALTLKKYSLGEIFYNTAKLGQILPEYYGSNVDLPPYYILLKLWSDIFGISESSLRSFSAIFGVLSIIMVYLLSKELFGKKTGIIASLLFSVNAIMIEYSQEARLYSMLIFIALLAAYFLARLLKTNENKHLAGFIASNIFGIYAQYTFLFFVIFEISFVFILFAKGRLKSKKAKISKIHIAVLSLMIFYIPLAARILNPKLVATHYLGKFSIGSLAKAFLQLNTWIYPSDQFLAKLDNFNFASFFISEWILAISAASLAALLLIFAAKNFRKMQNIDESKLFLLFWILIPLTIGFAVLYKSIFTFGSSKYFVFIIPAYLILAANGICAFKAKKPFLFALLLIILTVPALLSYYINLNKPQYKEASDFLEINSINKEIIIVNLPSVAVPLDYYSDKLHNIHGVTSAQEADYLTLGSKSLWLVLSTKYSDPKREIRDFFDENFRLEGSKKFHGVELLHYSKN